MQDTFAFDIVVVGAGVFGISTSLFLSLHYPQLRIALLEQFKIGHTEGSSHAQSRIIRSIYPIEYYRDLCLEGLSIYWPQVEQALGQQFIQSNPCISFVEPEAAFLEYKKVAESSNGQLQLLSIEQIRKIFPFAPKVSISKPVFLDTKAGVVLADKYLGAAVKFLRHRSNITIFEQTEVIDVNNTEKGVVVQAKRKEGSLKLHTKKIALSCGRWISQLVPEMAEIVEGVRQTVSYWQMKLPEAYNVGKFPSWIHYTPQGDSYYGLPDVGGIGMKYANHAHCSKFQKSFANQKQFVEASTARLRDRMDLYFKDDYVKINKVEKCYYTVIKSEDFLIDWRDEHQNVLVCSPCSGHGFKFGPIIGKIIADLLVKDKSIPLFEENRYRSRLHYHFGVNLK